jgi:excisionase family DNA binding protein
MLLNGYSDILTVTELAEILFIGKNTAYQLIRDGEIKSFKIGKSIKIPKTYVEEYILEKSVREGKRAS